MSQQKAWPICVDKRWKNWYGIKHTRKESENVANIDIFPCDRLWFFRKQITQPE